LHQHLENLFQAVVGELFINHVQSVRGLYGQLWHGAGAQRDAGTCASDGLEGLVPWNIYAMRC
jgi:hypothetical protein